MKKPFGFIRNATVGRKSVLDLGAGKGDSTVLIDPFVPWVGMIEIFKPYLDAFEEPKPHKMCGDMMKWRELVPDDFEPDCAMLIDSLEHLTRSDAIRHLTDLKSSFSRIVLFIPMGLQKQESDPWGYGNDFHQTHKSTWTLKDVTSLGFVGHYLDGYHKEKGSAFIGVWDK